MTNPKVWTCIKISVFIVVLALSATIVPTIKSAKNPFSDVSVGLVAQSLIYSALPITFITVGAIVSVYGGRTSLLLIRVAFLIFPILAYTWSQIGHLKEIPTFLIFIAILASILFDWLFWLSTRSEDEGDYLQAFEKFSRLIDVLGRLRGKVAGRERRHPEVLPMTTRGHRNGNPLFSSADKVPPLTTNPQIWDQETGEWHEREPLLCDTDSNGTLV